MSCIFVGQKKLTTRKYHICGTLWTDVAVSVNPILFLLKRYEHGISSPPSDTTILLERLIHLL